ncbi:MAG: hypothetical protein VB110_07245 [Bacteroidales bacterium]|nr:hypothetical protein [Bacteroidales bacterium]
MVHPYYHGTSELFLSSIISTGLGGINPNLEYGLLDILRHLYSISEDNLLDNEKYLKIRTTTKAMVNQSLLSYPNTPGAEKLNFEHGYTYVSCIKDIAISYAVNKEYGSEILTRIIHLYRLIKDFRHNFYVPKELDSIDIDRISKQKTKPVLICLHDIKSNELLTEFGGPSEYIIDRIFNLSVDYDKAWLVQNCNFRLASPIEEGRLKYYKIKI